MTSQKTETKISKSAFVLIIFALTFGRLIVNIGRRYIYPFLPVVARQLRVPLSSVQSLVAIQAGIGLLSPLFGPFSERYGRKRVMLTALALLVFGALIGVLIPQFWAFSAATMLLGLAKIIYDPTILAYLGDRIAYSRRGLAIGVTELSWSGSLTIAAPVAGVLLGLAAAAPSLELMIDMSGLQQFGGLLTTSNGIRYVMAALGLAGCVAFLFIALFLPGDTPNPQDTTHYITPLQSWQVIRQSPAAMGAMAYSLLLSMANEIFFINYGAWMEVSFELMLAALGAATTVIALAEIGGEFAVIGLADRFGKRRLALIGVTVSSLSYVILPFLNFNLTTALIGLFVMFLFVETGIVASIPLFTEVLPNNRAIMMSSHTGAASLGRLSGAILGGFLYVTFSNFIVIGAVATIIGLMAAFMLWRFVQE